VIPSPLTRAGNPPPPLTLAQAIALILESHDEQTKLLWQLVDNSARGGHGVRNAPALALTTYSDFAATHPPLFTEAGEPLEADHWLWVIQSKFGLLHCTEVQKTLFAEQHLRGDASVWWDNYTATHPDYQVSWTEFHSAFRVHYISAGMMRKKREEFMDLNKVEGLCMTTRSCSTIWRSMRVTPHVSNPHDYVDHIFKRT
jgi:hypothetical protein